MFTRHTTSTRVTILLVLLCSWIMTIPSEVNAQTYRVREIGALAPGNQWTYTAGINTAGNVVGMGSVEYFDRENAYRWTASTNVMLNLGTLGDADDAAWANNLNDSNVVVGLSYKTNGHQQAFSYNGSMSGLPYLPGSGDSEANAINNSGTIVGWCSSPATIGSASPPLAVRWAGGSVSLVIPSGWNESIANDISANDYIVGYRAGAFLTTGRSAFIKNSFGVITSIPKLSGYTAGNEAFAVNSSGIAVGASYTSGGSAHAFLYRSGDGTQDDLGPFVATDINNKARPQVIGSQASGGAFYFDSARGLRNLSAFVPPGAVEGGGLVAATSINDAGQIAAYSFETDDNGLWVHPYVLTPCLADFDENFALNSASDFGAFDTAYKAGDARADLNFDGYLTTADYTAFWAAFFAGCP